MTSVRSWTRKALLGLAIVAAASCADEVVHWGYSGASGPDRWGRLSPEFVHCANGVNQSPIDIVNPADVDLEPLEIHYDGHSTEMVNNGHTIQLNVEPGNWLLADGQRWNLAQFHFHSPSEHRIHGERFPIEAHFVHRGDTGGLLVLAVLFRDGVANTHLTEMWARLPPAREARAALALSLSEPGLLPDARSYYRYDGSLTTPPCTEGVRWYVLQSTKFVSPEQVSALMRITGENARPTQALGSRQILR